MKKVVVTGGAGFIGSHLVRALLQNGYEVHVVDNYAGGKREDRLAKEAIYHEVDVRDTDTVRSIFTDAVFVFHQAALPRVQFSLQQPLETNEVNVTGTLSALVAARDVKVQKFIYAASGGSVYGDPKITPFREDMSARPMSPYGLQKHIGELYTRLFSDVYGLRTVCLRYFNVYGPLADPEGPYALVIGRFLELRRKGKPLTITGDGTQTRDFTHVHDIVRANILAAENPNVGGGEMINIGAGRPASVNRIAELIGGPVEYIEARLEPHDAYADNALAKKLLGWEPQVTLEEGISQLLNDKGTQSVPQRD
jgi:nucleoside-diphosphate-sugar epimerase